MPNLKFFLLFICLSSSVLATDNTIENSPVTNSKINQAGRDININKTINLSPKKLITIDRNIQKILKSLEHKKEPIAPSIPLIEHSQEQVTAPNPLLLKENYQQDIVLDKKTNLTWKKPTNCSSYTWKDAKKYCENIGTGWRIPTKQELKNVFERKEIDSDCWAPNAYWSSTLESEKNALIVVYKSPSSYFHLPISNDDYAYALCVHN